MQDRHAAILGELSELSLSLARDLHQAALDAQDPADKAALASSFHKLSRSVRQTLALEAKLERDAKAAARQAQNESDHEARRVRQKRKDAIQEEVSRLIWTESERSDHDNDELEEDLEAILIFNDLPDLPDQEIIRQIADRLGLPCPRPKGAVEGVAAHRPSQSSPPGEVSAQRTEGVEGQDARRERASTPSVSPLSRRSTSPGGEDLEARGVYRDPIPIGRPMGLPGEFGPDGQTGDDRILPPI